MKFDSKAHMVHELISGKRFTSTLGATIYFDPSEELTCPFRCNTSSIGGVWELYAKDIWEEVTDHHAKPTTRTVYEWMYKHNSNDNWFIAVMMMSEERAKAELSKYKHRKTGRSWEVEA
jgi:hypothetical protein